jgi:hypothetical protein
MLKLADYREETVIVGEMIRQALSHLFRVGCQ